MSTSIMRDKSPNRAKIAELSEKLNNTHFTAKDQEMALEREAQSRLTQIEQQIDQLQKTSDGEIQGIREEAKRIEELIELGKYIGREVEMKSWLWFFEEFIFNNFNLQNVRKKKYYRQGFERVYWGYRLNKQKEFKIIENSLEIEINNERYQLAQNSPGDSSSQAQSYEEKFNSLKQDLGKKSLEYLYLEKEK